MYSIDEALGHLREVVLTTEEHSKAANGGPITRELDISPRNNEIFKLKDPGGNIFALAAMEGKKIRVRRLLHLKS